MIGILKAAAGFSLIMLFPLQTSALSDRMSVFVSISPQQFFVQQIGKNRVKVQVMIQPGASPHIYEPKPRQMVALSKARLYFAIGVEFEGVWLRKLSAANPDMQIVHTDAEIKKIPMSGHNHRETGHEDSAHEQDGLDPHIWLSPPLVRKQAGVILKALQEQDPAGKPYYVTNYQKFIKEIDLLHNRLLGIFASVPKTQFMVFHPSWGYFAEAYGLRQLPIEMEGKQPKPARLREIIKYCRDHKIKVIFVQPQFSKRNANLIAREIDGQVISVDPLSSDWLRNLQMVANKFKAALK